MRIKDIVHFSPNYKYEYINLDDKNCLIEAFEDRVGGFYLKPIEILNDSQCAFSAGLLCVTTIDFLARISINEKRVNKRIKEWLKTNIPDYFDDERANRFYDEFRNGLVHEGLIKNGGQFSYEIGRLLCEEDNIIVVNPELLLAEIDKSFKLYIRKLKDDTLSYQLFKCAILSDFYFDFLYAAR